MMASKLRSVLNVSGNPLAIILLAMGFAGCASMGGGSTVNPAVGTWDATVESPQGGIDMELLVHPDLTGSVTAGPPLNGTFPMSEVVAADGNLSFKIALEFQGQAVAAAITSTIEGDSITGTIATDFGDFPLTGVRK